MKIVILNPYNAEGEEIVGVEAGTIAETISNRTETTRRAGKTLIFRRYFVRFADGDEVWMDQDDLKFI